MREIENLSRRKALQLVGTSVVGAAGIGGQTAFAQEKPQSDEIRNYLHTFDPSNQKEIEEAVGNLLLIETRDDAEKLLFSLSSERQEALRHAIKNFVGLELRTGRELLHHPPERYSSDEVSTDADSRTYHCKGVLVNAAFGTTEAVFDHYVHWNYGDGSVSNFSHWKEVETPGWLTYWRGVTTDYIDNRGDHGVSKMGGNFEACVTNWGCYLSTTVGSGIWVYQNGDVACNPWDDEFESS